MRSTTFYVSLSFAVAFTLTLLACGDDDAPPLVDGGRDGGRLDAGTDSGRPPFDGGFDGGTDAGATDGGPRECDPGTTGITFPSRQFFAEVFAMGGTLDEPVGLAFDDAGALTVSNSTSWIAGTGAMAGTLLSFDASGAESSLASDDLLRGPAFLAWPHSTSMGFEGFLYVGIEDGDESGTRSADAILKVAADGSTVEVFADAFEPGEMFFGPGGAFESDLYVTSRESASASTPNPYRVYRYAADGSRTALTMMRTGMGEVLGAWALALGPGGALGTDLYVATLEDPGFSPGSADALFRVTSDGGTTLVAMGTRITSLAAPPLGTDFGERLYGVSTTRIVRVDAAGATETFAEGLMSSAGLVFGADGALYLAQPGASRIVKISRCPE